MENIDKIHKFQYHDYIWYFKSDERLIILMETMVIFKTKIKTFVTQEESLIKHLKNFSKSLKFWTFKK